MDSSYRHLAFLLSLGGIPVACTGDDTSTSSDTETSSATTSATGTTGADTMTGTASDGTSGTGTASGTDATSDPTTSATTGSTTDATTGETTGETTGGSSICEDFASFYVTCDGVDTYRETLGYCTQGIEGAMLYGEACVSAWTSLKQCQTEHTCREYEQGLGCDPEYDALILACVPEIGETCAAYGAHYESCDGPEEDPDVYCQEEILGYTLEYGEACGQAFDDYYACLSTLDCADLLAETGCDKEESAAEMLCD